MNDNSVFRLDREGKERTGHTGTEKLRGRWGKSDRKTGRKDV